MSELNGGQIPPQQYPQYQAPQPPKKKRTGLKIFLVVAVVCLVGLVSCVAVVGKAANDVSKDMQGTSVSASATDEDACLEALKSGGLKPYANRPAECRNVTGETYMKLQGEIRATEKPQATKTDDAPYAYSGLKVTRSKDSLGMFAGVITIKNNTDEVKDYYVEVTVFKGTQDVGSLIGTIKVKAHSSGQLKLTSLDDYTSGATDYQVQITPGL